MDSLNNITVLYVDDEPINLKLFKVTFRKSFNIVVATSGSEGLDILEKNPEIKAVISDLKMPYMSGLEFVEKAADINKSVIFFLLSGYSKSEEVDNAIRNGRIKKYFQKPFDNIDILTTLQKHLEISNKTC